MEFGKILELRRSIRKYKEGTVDKDTLERIINAAQQAPSWKNSQTARYYIAVTPDRVREVREKALPEFNKNNTVNASAIIVTAFEKGIAGFSPDGTPSNEMGNEWGAYDLGLQNMLLMLKACEEGLDTLVMGIRDEKALREEFGIPENQEVAAVISLGYRDTVPNAPARKNISDIAKFF